MGEDTEPRDTTRDSSRDMSAGSNTFALATVPFRRHFFLPTIVLGLAEIIFVGYPLWNAFGLGNMPGDVLLRTALPVAVGAVSAAHDVPLTDALAAYLHAALSQSVSAGIRLGGCGQAEGVAILAALEAAVVDVSSRASECGPDDLGTAAIRAEIASLRHETQNSRLFRS